ncbi:hypothetical protein [Leeia oryzae]|uniref:hypothetical protein n=1 Tax=Leeia oryzae TaxID=356662 RepID=UPI00037C79AE|nr:hypothetical protein [Leeia oryzae]
MRIILPVDSRVKNTQGFILVNLISGDQQEYPTQESFPFSRRGFRGGVIHDGCIYVCNSFSVKAYRVENSADKFNFFEIWQLQQPEWLLGKAANADLHALHFDTSRNILLLANSFMDSLDEISLDGRFLGRKFLWETSDRVLDLVKVRNPNAPDLCHFNHISMAFGQTFLTLGNLNASGKGAVLHLETGRFVIENLDRPHDGVFWNDEFWITETSAYKLRLYSNISKIEDFQREGYRTIDLSSHVNETDKFWCRGLYVTDTKVFVGCSQFQDRLNEELQTPPSHILEIDKKSGNVLKKINIPGSTIIQQPVLYSLLPY